MKAKYKNTYLVNLTEEESNRQGKLMLLTSLFMGSLVISNVIAVKLWTIPTINWAVPAGVVAYPITFLMTDIIGEVWGEKTANRVVRLGFLCALLSLILGAIAAALPRAPFFPEEMQGFFKELFAGVGRITFASFAAYFVSQSCDVYLFHRIRKITGRGHLWIRNNVATIISQLFDTGIFIVGAFYGQVPNGVILEMIMAQWSVKIIFALLDTPFCYWLVAWASK